MSTAPSLTELLAKGEAPVVPAPFGGDTVAILKTIPITERDETLRYDGPAATIPPKPGEADPRSLPEYERYKRFGEEIDDLKRRTQAQIGDEDARYINNLGRLSRGLEIAGRVLIHFSPEPITWTLGVVALGVHQQLEAVEIGHTVLHGAFDRVKGAEKYKARAHVQKAPINEECWRAEHNTRHHAFTSIVGKDPDLGGDSHRHSEYIPWIENHRYQDWFTALVLYPNGAHFLNFGVTGFLENFILRLTLPKEERHTVEEPLRETAKAAFGTLGRYVFKNYVVYPALAGPMFWKVMLGNFAAGTIRDIATTASFLHNHVGPDTPTYAPGTRPMNRGHWYAMQVEATNNFKIPRWLSIFAGGTDRHIEHHLFPTFPTDRLRQVAPEVQAICKKYGVTYREGTWLGTIKGLMKQVRKLAKPPSEGGVGVEKAKASAAAAAPA
jgi:linoleoyl-CoA desaturase